MEIPAGLAQGIQGLTEEELPPPLTNAGKTSASVVALDAMWARLRYVTRICSLRSTPPVRKLKESGSYCRAASMACTGETPGAPCSTMLRTARRVLMVPAAAADCDCSLLPAPCGIISTWKPAGGHASPET